MISSETCLPHFLVSVSITMKYPAVFTELKLVRAVIIKVLQLPGLSIISKYFFVVWNNKRTQSTCSFESKFDRDGAGTIQCYEYFFQSFLSETLKQSSQPAPLIGRLWRSSWMPKANGTDWILCCLITLTNNCVDILCQSAPAGDPERV